MAIWLEEQWIWMSSYLWSIWPRRAEPIMEQIYFYLFEEPPRWFPQWLCQFTPTPAVNKCSFPTSTPALVTICFTDPSHSDWNKMKSQSSSNRISLRAKDGEIFFLFRFTNHLHFVLRTLCSVLWPILKLGCLLSWLSVLSYLYILDPNPLSDVKLSDIFLILEAASSLEPWCPLPYIIILASRGSIY